MKNAGKYLKRRNLFAGLCSFFAGTTLILRNDDVAHAALQKKDIVSLQNVDIQGGWYWCPKCQGLWFAGNNGSGVCPAGGGHSSHSIDGSGSYFLLH